jgi:Protein of unknown function (DUF3060)
MKIALALSFSLVSSLLVSSAAAEVVFEEAELSVSHDCGKDPEVSISSASGTFTFTGACKKISVDGAANQLTVQSVEKISLVGSMNVVTIDAAGKISLVGSSNQVTWKKGLGGAKPKISNVGTANKVSKAK